MRRWSAHPLLLPALVVAIGFFVIPMALLLELSVTERFVRGQTVEGTTLANYRDLADGYHLDIVATTLKLGAVTTLIALVIGYPAAYALSRIRRPGLRAFAYFAIIAPLLTSVVVRTYGWALLLDDRGLVNSALRTLRVVDDHVAMVFQFSGVTIAMVHILLPFMVLPIVSVLAQVDGSLAQAAADLGASRWQTFRRVTLPLTLQGVLVGCELVFALSVSAFATPALLGGGRVQVLAGLIYNDVGNLNWPRGGAEAFVLLAIALLVVGAFNLVVRRSSALRAAVA